MPGGAARVSRTEWVGVLPDCLVDTDSNKGLNGRRELDPCRKTFGEVLVVKDPKRSQPPCSQRSPLPLASTSGLRNDILLSTNYVVTQRAPARKERPLTHVLKRPKHTGRVPHLSGTGHGYRANRRE